MADEEWSVDMTEPSPPPTPTTTTWAYCAWHKAYDNTCRLVQAADAGSGHGATGLFACRPCREAHRLTPIADPS